MDPIFDRVGGVCAWLHQGVIYSFRGEPLAYVRAEWVISYRGRYLGQLINGYFQDRHGASVAWMFGAAGGPTTPVPALPPNPPGLQELPPFPVVGVQPVSPVASLVWSRSSWDGFVGG
ncbi:4-fold beta flower protein [Streptomyces sp. CA-251387]|uniref:4-fold beta flower protein n=1 Tax=Streptomyces sp. CA-251387 TaxID=3240064 RepID=UPI003D8C696E